MKEVSSNSLESKCLIKALLSERSSAFPLRYTHTALSLCFFFPHRVKWYSDSVFTSVSFQDKAITRTYAEINDVYLSNYSWLSTSMVSCFCFLVTIKSHSGPTLLCFFCFPCGPSTPGASQQMARHAEPEPGSTGGFIPLHCYHVLSPEIKSWWLFLVNSMFLNCHGSNCIVLCCNMDWIWPYVIGAEPYFRANLDSV